MRVLCLVPHPSLSASERLRVEQYAPLLRDEGIELEVSPFLDPATYAVLYERGHLPRKAWGILRGAARRQRDVARASAFDLVLIHRESAPIGPAWVERALAARGIPYVYDFDDAIFLARVHPVNRRWGWLRPGQRAAETTRRARAVIVGNDYLAAWARRHNDRVSVLPTPVDTDRHVPRPPGGPDDAVVIGWVGSSTTAPYLHLLDEALVRLASEDRIRIRVIGGRYRHPTLPVEETPYDRAREPSDVAGFDIGVLPEPDDPWTRGKGAFKALVYMATALPVVASDVGVNRTVVRDGETGFCVPNDTEAWRAALHRLVVDADLRTRMGRAGRAVVERDRSVRAQAPRLARILRGALA